MRRTWRLAWCRTACLASWLSVQAAAGRAYTFTSIVDDTGPQGFFIFVSHPSVNDRGAVAFFSFTGGGGHGIFRGDGTSIVTIADSAMLDDATKGIIPVINDDGTVTFAATTDRGVGGIFTGDGGALDTIIDDSGKFRVFTNPAQNDAGAVAFSCILDDGPIDDRIFRISGGELTPIADERGQFCCLGHRPAINSAGLVAFPAFNHDATGGGIFASDGSTIITIADTNGPFSLFGLDRAPSINDAGIVAFHAKLDSGGEGIFAGSGEGVTTTIATSAGPFNALGDPAINAAGTVVFRATLDSGGVGIFVGPDPIADRVIGTGDVLLGSTVTGVQFYRGLNDRGQIAFEYELANGVRGVALATPGIPGDVTADGVVDVSDLLAVINAWGACPVPPAACAADVTGDGQVDVQDLLLIVNNWS